jgi:DNA-binding NarL/FixJ family response regulator
MSTAISSQIRALIVHGNPQVSSYLRSTLEEHGVGVIGETTEPGQILKRVRDEQPHVVLFDGTLAWPSCTSAQMVDQLRWVAVPGVFVLVSVPNEEQFFEYCRAGAIAYELDRLSSDDLVQKVQRAVSGEYLLSSSVLQQVPATPPVVQEKASLVPMLPSEQVCDLLGVTAREIEVLRYVMAGYGNKEIARLLGVSEDTVRNHLTNLNKRLQTRDRTHAVVVALSLGILSLKDAEAVTEQKLIAPRVARREQTPTARELDILRYVMFGQSNAEIAEILSLSSQTIKNHMTYATIKLGARNRTAAVVIALILGLLSLADAHLEQQEAVKKVLRIVHPKERPAIPRGKSASRLVACGKEGPCECH